MDDESAGNVLGLERYDKMVRAIAACHRVDEVKDIRDKARALEVYAAQAMNREAEGRAIQIRIRAERRVGELLIETGNNGERQTGKRPPNRQSDHSTVQTLKGIGVSKDQSSQWQKLAKVPKDKFEKLVKEPRTSTEEIIRRSGPPPAPPVVEVDARFLYIWGTLGGFERKQFEQKTKSILDYEPAFVVGKTDARDSQDIIRLGPPVVAWLTKLLEEVQKKWN